MHNYITFRGSREEYLELRAKSRALRLETKSTIHRRKYLIIPETHQTKIVAL